MTIIWVRSTLTITLLAILAVLLLADSDVLVVAALEVPPCEAINSTPVITVYRCTPDEGLPYLLNSVGFMVIEE
jgi:hypothetical protein